MVKLYDSRKLNVYYDIACQYVKNLPKRMPALAQKLNDIQFFIPIFHLYAHKRECHLKYSPRLAEDSGSVGGENTETLWSRLGPYGTMLREMLLMRHDDFLSNLLESFLEDKNKSSSILSASGHTNS